MEDMSDYCWYLGDYETVPSRAHLATVLGLPKCLIRSPLVSQSLWHQQSG